MINNNSKEKVFRILPYDRFEFEKLENYLSRMAAKGWMITSLGRVSQFVRCEPNEILFRIDPLSQEYDPDDDGHNLQDCCLFQEDGWSYAGEYLGIYAILYKEGKLQQVDQRVLFRQGRYDLTNNKRLMKNMKRLVKGKDRVILLILFLILLYYVINPVLNTSYTYHRSLISNLSVVPLYLIFFLLLELPRFVKEKRKISKLLKGYSCGDYATIKEKDSQKRRGNYPIGIIAVRVFEGLPILMFCIFLLLHPQNVTGDTNNCPYLSDMRINNIKEQINSLDYGGEYAYKKSSFFVPVQFQMREYGISHDREYLPDMDIEYYELRLNSSTIRFALSLFIDKYREGYESEPICVDGEFLNSNMRTKDNLNLYYYYVEYDPNEPKPVQILFGFSNKKVIYIKYEGKGELKDLVESVVNVMEG